MNDGCCEPVRETEVGRAFGMLGESIGRLNHLIVEIRDRASRACRDEELPAPTVSKDRLAEQCMKSDKMPATTPIARDLEEARSEVDRAIRVGEDLLHRLEV